MLWCQRYALYRLPHIVGFSGEEELITPVSVRRRGSGEGLVPSPVPPAELPRLSDGFQEIGKLQKDRHTETQFTPLLFQIANSAMKKCFNSVNVKRLAINNINLPKKFCCQLKLAPTYLSEIGSLSET